MADDTTEGWYTVRALVACTVGDEPAEELEDSIILVQATSFHEARAKGESCAWGADQPRAWQVPVITEAPDALAALLFL